MNLYSKISVAFPLIIQNLFYSLNITNSFVQNVLSFWDGTLPENQNFLAKTLKDGIYSKIKSLDSISLRFWHNTHDNDKFEMWPQWINADFFPIFPILDFADRNFIMIFQTYEPLIIAIHKHQNHYHISSIQRVEVDIVDIWSQHIFRPCFGQKLP